MESFGDAGATFVNGGTTIVQLPGAQDPARLKDLLGATATLEYRLEDTEHSVEDAVAGRVPVGSKLCRTR